MKQLIFLLIIPALSFSQVDIVGGEDADISDFPWQVALIESSGGWTWAFCGGSIIDNSWILTAAHCVEDGFAGTVYARAGSDNYYAQGGSSHLVDEIIIHPDYNGNTYNNDIALLKLNNPITQTVTAIIEGKRSGAKAFLQGSVTAGLGLTVYEKTGNFIKNEQLIINGVNNGRVAVGITEYSVSDVKSVYGTDDGLVGINTFNCLLYTSDAADE